MQRSPDTGSRARRRLVGCLLVAGVAVLLYSQTFRFGFVWDDKWLIETNPLIKPPFSLWDAVAGNAHIGWYWRPITMLSLAIDWRIGGGSPMAFHVSQTILHGLATLLVCAGMLLALGRTRLALLTGLLFALHPMAVETVSFASARDGLLCALGLFAASVAMLLLHHSRLRHGVAAYLLAAPLALGAKESGVVVALFPVVYAFSLRFASSQDPMDASKKKAVALTIAYGILTMLAFIGLRSLVLTDGTPKNLFAPESPLTKRLLELPWRFSLFVTSLFKLNGNPDWYPTRYQVDAVLIVLSLAIASMVVGAIWYTLRARMTGPFMALCLFCLATLPYLGIAPTVGRFFSESWLYPVLPAAGFACAYGFELLYSSMSRSRSFLGVALIAIVLIAGSRATLANTPNWRNDGALSSFAVHADPGNPRAWYNLGNFHLLEGRHDLAAEAMRMTLQVDPHWGAAYYTLGYIAQQRGELEKAEGFARQGLKAEPELEDNRLLLASLLLVRGEVAEALAVLRKSRLSPMSSPRYGRLLGEALLRSGDEAEGRRLLREHLTKFPDNAQVRALLEE